MSTAAPPLPAPPAGPGPGPARSAPPAPGPSRHLRSRLPALLAAVFFVAMSAIVLSQAQKMIEPDPYAYRASIAALEQGDVTLTQEQYDTLAQQLQQSELGGGISQWHQSADGTWVSEKNPGYPYLAVVFDDLGAIRLAPLFYGALACVGLYLGGRRWLGRWGGTFAVGAYCSSAFVLVMAWRAYMPTFTDTSLVAAGLGLLVWATLALDRPRRARVLTGAGAFLALGLAVAVRYTNVTVLAVAAAFALAVCLRRRWALGWRTLLWWGLAAAVPVALLLVYNAVYFEGPLSTGYSSTSVQFTLSAIGPNLRTMPAQLLKAMPVFVLAGIGVVGIAALQVRELVRRRRGRTTAPTVDTVAPGGASPTPAAVPTAVADRWVGLLLLAAWAAVWATYAAYEWTARMNGGGGPFGRGGPFGGGGPLGGASDGTWMLTSYSTVRFYLPAAGAIALLAAWVLARIPKWLGVAAIVGLFVFGTAGFLATVDGRWASTAGGGGFGGGGGFPGGGTPGGTPPSGAPPTGQLAPSGGGPGTAGAG